MQREELIRKRLTYPFRLLRNAFLYLSRYGLTSALSKVKAVVRGWFDNSSPVSVITDEQYHAWIKKYEKAPTFSLDFKYKPLISILMPVYNVDEEYLLEAFESVKAQTYENWELCMFDDASTKEHIRPLLEKFAQEDSRVKIGFSPVNEHISATMNKAFEISIGEFLYMMDNDDIISEHCFAYYVECINNNPDAQLIYSDEDKLSMDGQRIEPYFRSRPSQEMLFEMMYPTHAMFSRSLFEKAGKFRKGYEGSQDYDLALRAFELTDEIYHIPYVLYHWRKIPGSTADVVSYKPYVINASIKSISDAIERRGYTGKVTGENYPFKATIDIKGEPSVEIIIPTKDKIDYVKRCINSIQSKTTYRNYSITIVNNNSEESSTLNYFSKIKSDGVKVIDYAKPFNYSAINNYAVEKSNADYVLLLNNDTEVLTPRWIEEMLQWAQMDKTGAVGAKLLFPDYTVQHAGIILGLGPGLISKERPIGAHAFYTEPEGTLRHFNHLNFVQNFAAVTGACLLVKREKYLEVGGLNEEHLAVAYNDVDLGLKLMEAGYRNVYTPHAKLIHYESVTRSKEPAQSETNYMHQNWMGHILNDPYFNPNFDRTTIHAYVLPKT